MGYGLWVMGYGLWVMGYGLWVMGYGLWVMQDCLPAPDPPQAFLLITQA